MALLLYSSSKFQLLISRSFLTPIYSKLSPINYQIQCHHSTQIKEDEIIYKGNLLQTVKMIKIFSLSTSFIALLSQPLIFSKILENDLNAVKIGFVTISSFLILLSPLLLNLITKRYVYQLNYNSKNDEYTAYTLNFFNQSIKLNFKSNQVHFPMIPGLFTTFIVNSKVPLFVDSASVTNITAYQKLMGFGKNLEQINVNKEKHSAN